jgi:DNA (cytosine-5)-methyltransferase 1
LLDETRAQNFILENVPGLLSSNNGRDMAVVIEALVKRGYRIAYRVLDAQHFGVPQRRRRVFIVGCLGDTGRSPEEILAISQSRTGYLEASKSKRKDIATATATSAGVSLSNGKPIANCLPAELYHKSTVVNQDVNSGHLVLTQSSFGGYREGVGTLRANGGDLGGGSENIVLHES